MAEEAKDQGFRVKLASGISIGSGSGGVYKVRQTKRAGPSWVAPPNGKHTRSANAKAIVVDRSKGAGQNAIRNELRYAAKEGPLFERSQDGEIREADPDKLADSWQYDRLVHHVIVSPNDGAALTDPNEFAKKTLEYWEQKTGPLQVAWSVEEKPDRAHPDGNRHFHFVVRGEQDGKDLEFSAAMNRRGFREGAREAATDQLGYMTVRETRELERQMERMRWEREQERGNREQERTL